MKIRTDLISETAADAPDIKGIRCYEENVGDVKLSFVEIMDRNASEQLKKPIGKYCTIEFPRLDSIANTDPLTEAVVSALKSLYPTDIKTTLIVGLGNTDITPDALGPFTANGILATRHLSGDLKKALGLEDLKSVCSIIPGVLGKTGIEAFDLIAAAVSKIKPSLIIAVDALAARSATRLCRTIQLSDSGICPGSGVNNARKELSQSTFSIPVISLGIPTVIDANSLLPQDENNKTDDSMMVTPKDIDLLISKSAAILSRALNIFLQPNLDIEVISSLT